MKYILSGGAALVCAGIVTGCGGIVPLNEKPLEFGNITVNTTVEGEKVFWNDSSDTAKIIRIELKPVFGNAFTVGSKNTCKGELGEGVTCKAVVVFKPTEKRLYESELEIESEELTAPKERSVAKAVVNGHGV